MLNIYINNNVVKSQVYNWVLEVLKEYGVSSQNFLFNSYGKPYLVDFSNFNISHSDKKALLVVSNNDVGIDIDYLRLSKNMDTSSIYYAFYPDTLNKLTQWVCLEAYYKLLGYGFAKGINLAFNLEKIENISIEHNYGDIINVYKYNDAYFYTFVFNTKYNVAVAQYDLTNKLNIYIQE
jgi:phosphopantetheinyl transferase